MRSRRSAETVHTEGHVSAEPHEETAGQNSTGITQGGKTGQCDERPGIAGIADGPGVH